MAESKILNPNGIDAVNIIPINGKTDSNFRGTIDRCGRICFLSITNGAISASADEPFATVPVGYRPSRLVDYLDSYSKYRVQINENGQIICKATLNNGIIRGSVMYLSVS